MKSINQERKQLILKVAKRVIEEQGADSLHMKELSLLTGVPRASLYRTYASKEHIISEITLEWGMEFAIRLQKELPKGKTNGARIKGVFKKILKEAEDNPLLIAAVLENVLSTDPTTTNMQFQFEQLLPALLGLVVDVGEIPNSKKIMDILLRLLLASLQMLSSGRNTLNESLSHMVFAAETMMGQEFWQG